MRKCVDWLWKFVTVDKKNSSILNLTVETFATNLNYYDPYWTLYKFKTCDNSVIQPSDIQKVFSKKTKANYPQNPKGSPFLEQQGHMTHSSQVTSVPKEIGALFMGIMKLEEGMQQQLQSLYSENCFPEDFMRTVWWFNVLRMSVFKLRSMAMS